ncbi:50S ribosomal protein L29 [bacterium]|nr:50S ribosomal protein L29 [bacterium]
MKAKDLKTLPKEELKEKLEQTYEALENLMFQKATRQLENTAKISQTKREIARINTVISELKIR